MPRVVFTAHLRDHVPPDPIEVEAATVGGALARVFERHPKARSYILDDQGRLRRHVAVFVDGDRLRREALQHAVGPEAEIYVLQALSGG